MMYDTVDASKENYDKIYSVINYLQFHILKRILNYNREFNQWPTALEIYDGMIKLGHVYDKITIYARLTELRKKGMIASAGKKKRFTMNKLTDWGKGYVITLLTQVANANNILHSV